MARITIIEDEDDLGNLIASMLTLKGHEVRHARDARSGVAQSIDGTTDMVITDLNVPHSAALDELLGSPAAGGRPQVIVISGSLDSPHHAARALLLAGEYVIAKPFRMADLMRAVESRLSAPCGTGDGLGSRVGESRVSRPSENHQV